MEVFNQIRTFFRIPRLIVEFMVIIIFWFIRMTVPTGTDDWSSHLAVILHLPEMWFNMVQPTKKIWCVYDKPLLTTIKWENPLEMAI